MDTLGTCDRTQLQLYTHNQTTFTQCRKQNEQKKKKRNIESDNYGSSVIKGESEKWN